MTHGCCADCIYCKPFRYPKLIWFTYEFYICEWLVLITKDYYELSEMTCDGFEGYEEDIN